MKTFLLAVTLCFQFLASSQTVTVSKSRVAVSSNVAGGTVYIDSVEFGRPPVSCALDSGNHFVCLASGGRLDWGRFSDCREIYVDGKNDAAVMFDVPLRIQVISEPYGALAAYRDSVIGTTPCVFTTRAPKGSVTLSKAGFDDLVLMFDTSTVLLFGKFDGRREDGYGRTSLYLESERPGNSTPLILTASGAVLAGVGAAWLKIRADNVYNDYRLTGDAKTLSEVRRLDALSAVSLVASQASLGLLIYFLVSN